MTDAIASRILGRCRPGIGVGGGGSDRREWQRVEVIVPVEGEPMPPPYRRSQPLAIPHNFRDKASPCP
jgi:hypothetical protein